MEILLSCKQGEAPYLPAVAARSGQLDILKFMVEQLKTPIDAAYLVRRPSTRSMLQIVT